MKIKVKKQFSFRELVQYIIENDITGKFISDYGKSFSVRKYGAFRFGEITYNNGETYEIEVLEDVDFDKKFANLIVVFNREGEKESMVDSYLDTNINKFLYLREICKEDIKKIYTYVNDDFQLVWEREDDDN